MNRIYAALFCGALALATVCPAAPPRGAAAPARPQQSPTTGERWVILTPREARSGILATTASSYWTPSRADIRRLEAILRQQPKVDGYQLPAGLLDYYRQYVGIVVARRRMIYVNGFSATVAPEFTGGARDWHHAPVFVNDGGRSFFHATYDPKARQFSEFRFNGLG